MGRYAAHIHTSKTGQMTGGAHQIQFEGGHPRVRSEHLKEVSHLVQYDVAGMGLFERKVVRLEGRTAQGGNKRIRLRYG